MINIINHIIHKKTFLNRTVTFLNRNNLLMISDSSAGKNLPVMLETSVQFLGWEDALKKETATTPVFLFTEFHGQRSLVG